MIITIAIAAMTPIITSAPKLPNIGPDPDEDIELVYMVVETHSMDVLFASVHITSAVSLQT